MPTGFFSASTVVRKSPFAVVPRCGACGIFKQCLSPKMPVTGDGERGILVVAEAPGQEEDEQGTQLIGRAGQHLRTTLRKFGVDLDKDCWKTNSLICRPSKDGVNRKPTDDEIDHCRPNLFNTIKKLKPVLILPLGEVAVKSLIGRLWREATGAIGRWVGWQIPDQQINAWIAPTWHPSYLVRDDGRTPPLKIWWERHLESAVDDCTEHPWPDGPPDCESKLRIETDPAKAARWLDSLATKDGMTAAVDIESTTLKPDSSNARIVSCAVAVGRTTAEHAVSYVWDGPAIDATRRLVASRVPIVASNLRFEERWFRKEFGHGVRNWVGDTMLDAHVLDNRRGITSIKFQGYVQCGFPVWDDHIKQFLESDGSNTRNRIHEIDLTQLLRYGGYDALVELDVYFKQQEQLNAS